MQARNVQVDTPALDRPPLPRELFPITRRWAYCNHAAVGPLPQPTRDAVAAVLDAQMNDGCAGILDVEAHLEQIRAQTAAAINASADEIAFLRATSDGALLAANGIRWRDGDEIILTDNEFGANAHPWLNLRDRGVRVRLVRAPQQRLTVDVLAGMRTRRTRLVAASEVTSVDGYRHDVAALGRYCREHDILFAVDAMQSFGGLPLDVRAGYMDFCYCGVAKWLLAPQGLSFVFVRKELIEGLRPAFASWRSVREPMSFFDYGQEFAVGARRFEGATVNYPALIGFSQSLSLLERAGLRNIERHVLALNDRAIAGLQQRGWRIVSDLHPARRSGIVLAALGKHDEQKLNAEALRRRVGITVRDTGVRIAPHGYNDASDIDAVLDLLGSA